MQVEKVREAVEISKKFIRMAEEVLEQAQNARFLLCDGKHAKLLKPISNKVIQAMNDMRRP